MANQTPSTAIVFRKHFTSGILAGLVSSPQYLGFVNQDSRLNWLKGVKANQANGSLNWVFEGDVFTYPGSWGKKEALEDYSLWGN